MLRRLIGEDVELVDRARPTLACVKADPARSSRCIMNLAVNARDAMPTGGDADHRDGQRRARRARGHGARPDAAPGRYVVLAVTDTGARHGRRRCRPASSSRSSRRRSRERARASGLATVYGIVKQSGGLVRSTASRATAATFRSILPGRAGDSRTVERPVAGDKTPHGDETILLVEDEDAVRSLTRAVLRTVRLHRARGRRTGADALASGRERTPTHRPARRPTSSCRGWAGANWSSTCTVTRPGLQVLYLSGYPDDAVVRHGVLERRWRSCRSRSRWTHSPSRCGRPWMPSRRSRMDNRD